MQRVKHVTNAILLSAKQSTNEWVVIVTKHRIITNKVIEIVINKHRHIK